MGLSRGVNDLTFSFLAQVSTKISHQKPFNKLLQEENQRAKNKQTNKQTIGHKPYAKTSLLAENINLF